MRTLKQEGKAGFNRAWWDFKDDPTTELVMRTKPRYAEWFPLDDDRTREPPFSPISNLVPPGTYQVHLLIAGDKVQTQTIKVLKDPNSEGTLEDIQLQTELLAKIKSDFEDISVTVNEIELIRRQLLDLKPMLSDDEKEIKDMLITVESTILELENEIIQLKTTGTGQDGIRFPGMLMKKLSYLSSAVATADFRPPNQHQEVFEELTAAGKM